MARRIVAEFDAVTGPFLQKLNRIDASINRFERGTLTSFNRVERGVNSLVAAGGRLRSLTGFLATGFGVNLGAQFLDQSKLIRNALREAGDTSEETFNKVFQSSVRALAGFRDTASGVQRFQKALGDQQAIDQSIRQLETLNKLLALSGKTQQERSSTFIQFSQALQAGYLGGEELRAIRENAPIELTREIARVAGGTIEDLKALSKEGLLTTEVMVQALKNLEEEADKRFDAIEVTIQDAAKVFQSGAIIAAEGFDEGLGASEATVAGLKNLGTVLGENGEAFETFGKAVKVAGGLLITSFAGRRIRSVIGNLGELKTARLQAAVAAEAEFAAAQKAQQQAQANLSTRTTQLATLTAQGKATRTLEAAQKRQTKAARTLQAANQRLATAYNAVTAAQNRLLFSQRALAASASLLRGAYGLLGGLPGILLTAATAFFVIRDRIQDAAAAQQQLLNVSSEYVSTIDELTDRRRELKDLLDNLGGDNLDGASAVINSLRSEIQALERDLEAARATARDQQQQRIAALNEEQAKLDQLIAAREFWREQLTTPLESFQRFAPSGQPGQRGEPLRSEEELRAARSQALQEIRRALATVEAAIAKQTDVVEGWQNAIDVAQDGLQSMFRSLNEGSPDATASVKEIEEAFAAASEVIEKNKSDAEKLTDEIARLQAIYDTLQGATGDTSEISEKLARVISDLEAQLRAAKAEASGLSDEMLRLKDALDNVNAGNLNIEGQLETVRRQIAAARAGASRARVEAIGDVADIDNNRQALVDAGLSAGEIEALRNRSIDLRVALAEANKEKDALLGTGTTGGGRGGASGTSDLERAAQIVERQMTFQERMRREIEDAVRLRDRLAQGTDAERAAADQLSAAIERMKDEYAEAIDAQDEFFGDMSRELADAITDWTNFGDVVRSILSDLVNQYGPDFFRAILTPGQQSGDDLGTRIGNIITGLFHDGGRSGRRRSVSPLAFIGAPRFHKGLMPDEFPAILQKGEAVIPKNLVGSMGMGATFVFNNDFRNADPQMKPWIEAQLARQRAEFESRWVSTARKVNMSRMKI